VSVDEPPLCALHACRSRPAAQGDRCADGLAARRGVEAVGDLRTRRRGALEEIDRAFRNTVTPLRAVKSDSTEMQTGARSAG
jgi:hypothetical protein